MIYSKIEDMITILNKKLRILIKVKSEILWVEKAKNKVKINLLSLKSKVVSIMSIKKVINKLPV